MTTDKRFKTIPKGARVKWRDFDHNWNFGTVIDGPHAMTAEEKSVRQKMKWPIGPMHNVKQDCSVASIITSQMKVTK